MRLTSLPTSGFQTLSAHLASPVTQKNKLQSFDRDHWKEVALAVQRKFRSTRLKVLEEINQMICGLICSRENLPKLNLALIDAEAQEDIDLGMLEREFNEFAIKSLRQLPELRDSASATTNLQAHYGGKMGDVIFRTMNSKVVIPMLTSLFQEFVGQTNNVTYEDKSVATSEFLHATFLLAGNERGKIAHMTDTEFFKDFGRLVDARDGPISDTVSRWKPWETMMIGKICQVIASGAIDANLQDFLDDKNRHLCRLGDVRLMQWPNGEKVGFFFASSLGEDHGERARFWFTWSPQQAKDKAAHPIEISELRCEHPPRFSRIAEEVLAPAVLDALFWEPHCAKPLESMLASILYDLSHTSTFARGTASISEVMIKAIAAVHGYELEFSQNWTPPNNPQPDQQALAEFDRDKFIETARKNIILRKTG